jgi:ribonuclease HIII
MVLQYLRQGLPFCTARSSLPAMPALTTYTKPLTSEQATRLRALLAAQGFDFETKPHCLYAGTRPGVNVLVYAKGPKVLVQGKGTEDFVTMTLEPQVLGVAEIGYEEVHHPEMFQPHIGVDESGKGDYFGPLVIAGVFVDAAIARHLQASGVMDSKRITSDARIFSLAQVIRTTPGIAYEVVAISPERYNEMHASFGNLNKLLAWGHARVIENLLAKRPECPQAISDQFANPAVLQRALGERGKTIELIQRTKAESDPAVAAASILAREKFVNWLRENSQRLGLDLPKGASEGVKLAAKSLVARLGANALAGVAKMHFKTTHEVLSTPMAED